MAEDKLDADSSFKTLAGRQAPILGEDRRPVRHRRSLFQRQLNVFLCLLATVRCVDPCCARRSRTGESGPVRKVQAGSGLERARGPVSRHPGRGEGRAQPWEASAFSRQPGRSTTTMGTLVKIRANAASDRRWRGCLPHDPDVAHERGCASWYASVEAV
jgi:hypothetical protein